MSKALRTFSIAVFILALAFARAGGASFTASLDRDTISFGESATLSLVFQDGQPKTVPQPAVQGLQIVQVGNQTGYSFVNGTTSSTLTVLYSVTAREPGEFEIPAMTVDISGQQVSSQPRKLTVTKVAAPSAAAVNSGSELAFLKLTLPKTKIYSGETVVGKLELFLRDDVQSFANFQLTAQPADGFSIGKMVDSGRFRAQIGNRAYAVVRISFPVTAMRAGDLTLGPISASAVVILPSRNNGDPFAQFFNQGEQKQVTLATEQISAASQPLPENAPTNFSGAIGNYQLAVSAGPTNIAAGDPITVRIQISGHGSLDTIKLPDQTGWNDFKVFSPTSKTDVSDQFGLEGTKTFEEIVTPQNTDVHALPEFSFSFFNPDDGQYHMLTKPAVPLIVHSAGASALPTIAANKNSGNENQAAPDILPIKQNFGTLEKIPAGQDSIEPLISNPAFLGAQTLPIIAFLAAFIWRKRADNLANNPRWRRKIAVEKMIQRGIADLKKFAVENNSEEFFALLFRLLQEQLGERLDCPATAITENVVEENSILRGAPENLRNDLRELFQLCNQARYAPVRGTAELNSVTEKFGNAMSELQNVKA